MYGATAAYTCTGTLAPFTGSGINFLLTNNSDPVNSLDYKYNYYHVPTGFEYVGIHKLFAHGFVLDVKPYTYNYDNSEKYTNVTPITEATTINGSSTYAPLDLPIHPCDVAVVKKGVTAIPCGVDKYNSYRKNGETSELDQASPYCPNRTTMPAPRRRPFWILSVPFGSCVCCHAASTARIATCREIR
jgi:iron complex outermembrane receptor protein